MSSHWEWVEEVMAEHDKNKPFAPENGQPLRFAVGDKVVFTNDFGVEFTRTVIGIYERPSTACGQYAHGARYYLDSGASWFPHKESSLRMATEKVEEVQ